MGIRSDIEGEFFPKENFELPSGVYLALTEISFAGFAVEVITPDVSVMGATAEDVSAAEKAYIDALVYRIGLRAFKNDTAAGNYVELQAQAQRLR